MAMAAAQRPISWWRKKSRRPLRRRHGAARLARSSRPLARSKAAAIAMLAALAIAGLGVAPASAQQLTPINLRITPGLESLSLRWGVTSTEGLAGFRVRWRPLAALALPWSAPVELGARARRHTITGLSIQPYEVRVAAILTGGKLGGAVKSVGTPLEEYEEGSLVTFVPSITPLSAAEIPNAMRGQYLWNGSPPDPPGWPVADVYYRDPIQWKNIEPSRGVYNFSIIEKGLAKAQARGGKFGFRVMAFSPWFGNDVAPSWIPTDPANSNGMVEWNNPVFLSEWGKLMAALGARFANDPRLGWVDIGGYGDWGEWHLWKQEGIRITEANMNTLMSDVVNAFPNKTTLAMTTNATFLADAMKLSPHVGVRMDCLGTQFGTDGALIDQVPAALERWKTAPVVTEWCNDTLGELVDEYALGDSEVAKYHISLLSSGNYPERYGDMSTADKASFQHANKSSGYRYELDEATLPAQIAQGSSFEVASSWANVNFAPAYEAWSVQFELRDATGVVRWTGDSSLDLRRLLPTNGTAHEVYDKFVLPSNVGAGIYTLAVRVVDSSGYLSPMHLADQVRLSDGSYLLGTVAIT
jgi:hypothetical protein